MPIGPIEPIQNGESGLSVRAKINLLLQGAVDGSLGSVTQEDLDKLVDTVAPAKPQDFELDSTLVPENLLLATWDPSLEEDFAYYELHLRELDAVGNGTWISYVTALTLHKVPMIPNTEYEGFVISVDKSGNKSPPSDIFKHTTAGDEVPPAMPLTLTAKGGIDSTWLGWLANTEGDLARYEIYEALSEFPAPDEHTAPTHIALTNSTVIGNQAPEVTRFYWVRAVDTSGNASPWSAPASATTSKVRSEIKVTLVGILFSPGQAPGGNRLAWTAGSITYGTDGSAPDTQAIPAGTADFGGATAYIYYVLGDDRFSVTTSLVTLYSQDSVLIGVYRGGTDYQTVEGRAYFDGGLILAQTIGANQLVADQAIITGAAQIAEAIITNAHIVELSAAKLIAGTALANSITVGGNALGDVSEWAADPAERINHGVTQIDPGLILISGGTSLADWRSGGDSTKIDGGNLETNSVAANVLRIGARGVSTAGIAFSGNTPTANRVSWSGGKITYVDDAGSPATVDIVENPIGAMWTDSVIYIYWAKGATSLSSTTLAATAFAANHIVLATYNGGLNLTTDYGRTIIDGTGIKTGSIQAAQIATGAVNAEKIAVANLAAISANLGAITGGSMSIGGRFIVASDGTVTIRSATTGQRVVMTNTLLSVYDGNNVLRVRLGMW